MYQLFFTDKEVRKIIDTFTELHDKEFVQLILEQVFKKDLTIKDTESIVDT